MKTKKVIFIAAMICVAVIFSCHRPAGASSHQRINRVSNFKQAGLASRMRHNEFNPQFRLTGDVVAASLEPASQ